LLLLYGGGGKGIFVIIQRQMCHVIQVFFILPEDEDHTHDKNEHECKECQYGHPIHISGAVDDVFKHNVSF